MASPRIELGHGPRQRPGLPLAYEAFSNNKVQKYEIIEQD